MTFSWYTPLYFDKFNECYEATYFLYEKHFYEYQNIYKNNTGSENLLNKFRIFYYHYYLNFDECLSIRNQSLSTPKSININSSFIKEIVTTTEKLVSKTFILTSEKIPTSTKTKDINIPILINTIPTSFKIIIKKTSHSTKTISKNIPTSIVTGKYDPYLGAGFEARSCCNKYGYCDKCADDCQTDSFRCLSINQTTFEF
ncbi:hypothetical protein H8356DRAFT_1315413 [Neocallimastix lanati (nom. inval.)]|uniref:Uncharacterized protein n=1 Tax=Neocallimastix californiae TaxID=1754190 RepID=A0A1Y2CCR1_9FUNG|nr:hypothetical protein H8356DRAFT_1315413 [Neocallimastix sp. JGI-2020a]ORY44614.1 hypothetical protein LY90DRAFT_509629 [Neocallimastix californiae]|eukprot:ORY44614.1 hypothetical protein LY90DRAFT_509629 [Neocallimastix californiae]